MGQVVVQEKLNDFLFVDQMVRRRPVKLSFGFLPVSSPKATEGHSIIECIEHWA